MILNKSIEMTSDYIKAAILANFRFAKQYSIMATEVHYSDVLAINKNEDKLIEVEVKVSKTDLLNDFGKFKHKIYGKIQDEYTPHEFYFCVPKELIEDAIKLTTNTPYGVMECRVWRGNINACVDKVIIRKRANKLHDKPISIAVKKAIISRMASELINHKLITLKERKINLQN